jgi:hypothetical protein
MRALKLVNAVARYVFWGFEAVVRSRGLEATEGRQQAVVGQVQSLERILGEYGECGMKSVLVF